MPNILLIDDDPAFTSATRVLLEADGHEVRTADCLSDGKDNIAAQRPDLLIVDLSLPDGSGLELVTSDAPPIIIITGHPTVETAIRAVSDSVVEYLVKPIDRAALQSAIADAGLGEKVAPRQAGMVGDSPAMQQLYQEIEQYGSANATVLVIGESGTGKELVAQALHERRDPEKPLVVVNCGAIAAELIASELFGHEKGSFTGAGARRLGHFENAGEGTVFLDEVGELPMEQQVALLRILENRTLRRVGGDRDIAVKARVVAATNKDLASAVAEGQFREDLFFRLNVLPIAVPPLRDRGDDVLAIAQHFLAEYAEEFNGPTQMSDGVKAQLQAHRWPGNVRELKHTILRASVKCAGRKTLDELPQGFEQPLTFGASDNLDVGMSIRDAEKRLIEKTLEHYKQDKKVTAEVLGVSLKTLYNRLTEYKDDAGDPPAQEDT